MTDKEDTERYRRALEAIDRAAEAGMCQFGADGKHAFLRDIRKLIAGAGVQGGLTKVKP